MRARESGFTLIELTVALVAGLAVVLGLMALSKEASRTFNEEVRSTASESSLRTANDRLRADLSRAGFMSTGNIQADPNVCLPLGTAISTLTLPAQVKALQSIVLYEGGTTSAPTSQTPLSTNQSPALAPDIILIAGNMTTAEQLPILSLGPAPTGNCTRIILSPVSPALYRIAPPTSTQQAQDFTNAFQPVAGKQFIVRLLDETGHAQYLETCNESTPAAAGMDSSNNFYVDIAPDTVIYAPNSTQTKCGVGPQSSGHAFLNPVQVVRWEIVQATVFEATNAAQYSAALGNLSGAYGTIDPNKYDLVRSYVDALGSTLYASSELVAEYAVDLDFAFSIDSGTALAPVPKTFAFEDNTDNDAWSGSISTTTSKPQRLRDVRYRLVTRTGQGDRTVNVAVAAPTQYGSEEYLYRYCINPTSCTKSPPDGTLCWARTRTVTGEASLPNLQSDYF
jgi:hypothetical protein